MQIGHASKHLIDQYSVQHRRILLLLTFIVSNYLVKVVWNEIHHQIQKTFVTMFILGEEKRVHLYTAWMTKHLNNFKFSVRISWILKHLLNSQYLSSLLIFHLENFSERSLTNSLFPNKVVRSKLLLTHSDMIWLVRSSIQVLMASILGSELFGNVFVHYYKRYNFINEKIRQ